ncbi:MAG: carboxypeptidase regulatory-like domain-containing protein [bacterium]|nr:carboxypeptidase regulatory-like domain-containing protein [bacterium]
MAAWEADHIVAVRVGGTVEVLEVWVGGLSLGDVLDVPGLESLDLAAYEEAIKQVPRTYPYSREPGGGVFVDARYDHGGEIQSLPILKLLEGTRAVLFLHDDEPDDDQPPRYPWLLTGSERRFTRPHPHREALPLSVAWESESSMWALAQYMNPGPLAPHWVYVWSPTEGKGSPFNWEAFHAQVVRARTKKRELEAVLATEDPEERMRALRAYDAGHIVPATRAVQEAVSQYLGAEVIQPAAAAGGDAAVEKALLAYIDSDLFVPEVAAFAAMAGVGRPGVPALQALLERPECAAFRSRIIDSLNGADGQHLAREFRQLLVQENAYWRDRAAELSEPGWLDSHQGDDAQTREARRILSQHAEDVTRLLWIMKARLEEENATNRRDAIGGWVEVAKNGVPPDQRQALAERIQAALVVPPSDDSYAALCLDAIRECREVWAALPARRRNGDEVKEQDGMAWLCDGILKEAEQGPAPKPLELSPAVVRVFASMADLPNDYMLMPVLFEGHGFSCNLDEPAENALLRLVAEDQPDAAFAALLGSSVHTWRHEEGRRYHLNPSREPMDCVVSDALCQPIANAAIVGMLNPRAAQSEARRFSEGPWQTDAEGRVTIAAYRGDFWSPPKLVVSHPDYGRSDLIPPHPKSDVAPTGLVRRDSDAAKLALRGVVVDREGQPIEGASMHLLQAMTPGCRSGRATVYTDAAGRFCLYPPPVHYRIDDPLGPLPKISRGCTFLFEVAGPDRSYLRKGGQIASGKEARVVLDRGLYRVLAFEDENGPITDPKRLATLRFSARDLDDEAEWKDGHAHVYVRPGKLAASLPRNTPDGLVRCAFAPIMVAEDGPTELVFQLQPPPARGPRIVGTAMHAVTGKPLAGVLVANGGGNIVQSLAMLTAEEWEVIESMPVHPDASHPGFKLLQGMTDCARSDESGSYCIELPPSHDVHYVTAFARDFLVVHRWPNARSRSGDCVITIEPFRMFPAGTVSLRVLGSDAAMAQVANWRVDDPALPDWALPLVKGSSEYEGGIGGMRFIAIGEGCRGSVPAGVQVSFRVPAMTRTASQTREVDRRVKVTQGEHVDLGEVTLQATAAPER